MKIGDYELHAIETGSMGLDGGAMFGVVPRVLWQRSNPPDEKNRIAMVARALLLVGNGRRVLIDTGNGAKYDEKFASIYKLDSGQTNLISSLQAHGLTPSDITDVLLTHLHFDHAGGATSRVGNRVEPTFPHATYYVQRAHWEAATHPTERDRASFVADDFMPLRAAGVLTFLEGEQEFLPGIQTRIVHGHTTALQCPLISDGETTLLYCADLVPMASHVQLPWIMGYDLRPLVTLEEKRLALTTAAKQEWVLFFEHDPAVAAARIRCDEKGFSIASEIRVG